MDFLRFFQFFLMSADAAKNEISKNTKQNLAELHDVMARMNPRN